MGLLACACLRVPAWQHGSSACEGDQDCPPGFTCAESLCRAGAASDASLPDISPLDRPSFDMQTACVDYALSFNGENWVTVPDSPALDSMSAITVEAWIFPTLLGEEVQVVSHHHHTNSRGYVLLVKNDRAEFRIYTATDSFTVPRSSTGTTQLVTGRWYHLAGTSDGVVMQVFVDGLLQSRRAIDSGQFRDYAGPLRIGGASYDEDFGFHGLIDDVRVSSTVRYASNFLVPAEPLELDPNTVALWNMEDAPGQQVHDQAGLHHGTRGDDSSEESSDPGWITTECAPQRSSGPPDCETIYGRAPNFDPCPPGEHCMFYTVTADLTPRSCGVLCEGLGGECLGAWDDDNNTCDFDTQEDCQFEDDDQICTCSSL
jgi:hypothetical protein